MLHGKTVAVVVPAYNEESQIAMVIETMPQYVDRIIIVNDKSKDNMASVVEGLIKKSGQVTLPEREEVEDNIYNRAEIVARQVDEAEVSLFNPFKIFNDNDTDRLVLINHTENGGVGAAISTGYKWCKDHDIDCTAVMAGDGQMDPSELEGICLPVVKDGIDYVKGNRLIHRSARLVIPAIRYFGNSILSILTKLASGYWHVSDTQTGYTAIGIDAMKSIRLYNIYRSYGMPNDMLVKLNMAFCTLKEVPIKPIYDVGEQSKMKIFKVIPRISWLLIKSFFKRLWIKYLVKDFHPLFLLYNMSFILFGFATYYAWKIWVVSLDSSREVNELTVMAFMFLFISGLQSIFFAMWMDMQDNERLYKS